MLPPFHMLIDAKLWFSFLITKHNFKKLSHELLEWFVFEPTELWYDVLDSNVSYFCMSGKFFIFYFQVFCVIIFPARFSLFSSLKISSFRTLINNDCYLYILLYSMVISFIFLKLYHSSFFKTIKSYPWFVK